ncbi:cation:proton antiporter [Yaniella halotolerans]|uniref:cation:proton antiporter n=1 Tax=Yaniella halotolerans TaxID=225453 RepID=UPI001FE11ACA|nr:monovalent cation/H(+) antiporter subunit G [Yaniella halotolerans]
MSDLVVAVLLLAGGFFFTAGTVGIIRFPDLRSQLHALTKADNLGLGLMFAGVAVHLGSWSTALILLLIWLLALIAASVSARVLAGTEPASADQTGEDSWRR